MLTTSQGTLKLNVSGYTGFVSLEIEHIALDLVTLARARHTKLNCEVGFSLIGHSC